MLRDRLSAAFPDASFHPLPGMCAIFGRDRLGIGPGCTPSSPGMAYIFFGMYLHRRRGAAAAQW